MKQLLKEIISEGWNWAYQEDPDSSKKFVARETGKLIEKFSGKKVKFIGYKSDPEVLNVYLVVFTFPDKRTGMCIVNLKDKKFIEEPSDIEDYGHSLEDLQKKYRLQRMK